MSPKRSDCPDCDVRIEPVNRRDFIKVTSAAALAGAVLPGISRASEASDKTPESVVKILYDSLTDEQKKDVCFDWDYQHPTMGLLRTRISANWHITKHDINSRFFTADQRAMVRDIFEGIVQPEWHAQIDKQLEDDAGGFGEDQNIAIFGKPGDGKFQFVMTGRRVTMRCDGNSADHVAFGGPIFYGHDAGGAFEEDADHPGNVFWPQAVVANKLLDMLDGKQRKLSLVKQLPREQAVAFRGPKGEFPGIPVTELSSDQKEHVQKVLQKLIEPYRQSDRDEVVQCLKAQGGLDACSLAFYQQGNIGDDQVWDCWRLEGPSFVWYFRGSPHVHVWVNIADNPSVKLNA